MKKNTALRKKMIRLQREATDLREKAYQKEKEADYIMCHLLEDKNLNAWKLQRSQ